MLRFPFRLIFKKKKGHFKVDENSHRYNLWKNLDDKNSNTVYSLHLIKLHIILCASYSNGLF